MASANVIRELRIALSKRFGAHYSQSACAARVGVSTRSWAAYEKFEKVPSVEVGILIARDLAVTVEQLWPNVSRRERK